ncbi:MAG: putative colanic acid biosynthesis acetyltransferase [Akkermansiaceae bacterium]|nr:putative colanic acid biosynthesis acetyltransferase [Verrucomicrobiales bacterium]
MSKPTATADAFTGPSFSLSNRLARWVWGIAYQLLFRPSPRPLHAWRGFLLTLFGARLGKGCHIYPRAVIWAPWNLECGDQVGVADGAILYNQATISLGARAVISQGSHLCTGSHDYELRGFPLFAKPIRIGSEVWLAAECFVHPGVTIGDGAVVGARSVVTKNLPAWMVCTGAPCKAIKPRVLRDFAARPVTVGLQNNYPAAELAGNA